MRPLRISLTLSGGASLGAYQAGATAALIAAVEHLRDEEGHDVAVTAVGGASAGSLVALMAAHSLLEGHDAPSLLSDAWVEEVSITMLMRGDARGPLSLEEVRRRAPEMLAQRRGGTGSRQESPIALHVALTGLRGLTYEIPGARDGEPIQAATYLDWGSFVLEPGGGVEQLVEPEGRAPLDFVLASAAHPGGFAPRLLDRRADRGGYEREGISGFPESGRLWYTDGGLLQSEPVGRVLRAERELARDEPDAKRLALVIDPRSEVPSAANAWSDPERAADWAGGLARALAILPAQALYDDLRRVARDNQRLAWLDQLVESVAPHLNADGSESLRALLDSIARDQGGARGSEAEAIAAADAQDDPAQLLRAASAAIAGLAHKQPVTPDVISPVILAGRAEGDVSMLLAGEHLGDFGGFLDARWRRSDFALGYESGVEWARRALEPLGVAAAAAERTIETVAGRRPAAWQDVRRGREVTRDLPWRARLRLGRMALRAARSLVHRGRA